jgi:hypothetical protein
MAAPKVPAKPVKTDKPTKKGKGKGKASKGMKKDC